MYKTTIQQIILFIITSFIIFKTGEYMVKLNGITSFTDFAVITLFFISFVLFLNYFSRLVGKIYNLF